jgi:hypothetical protein
MIEFLVVAVLAQTYNKKPALLDGFFIEVTIE